MRTGRSGVADDVRQCFLDDAIGRDVDALGKGSDVPGDIDVDVDAGLAGLVDKVVELSEAWCRFELSFAGFVGLAEDADEATHLAQRSSTGGLDDAERVSCFFGFGVEEYTCSSSAHRDHGH